METEYRVILTAQYADVTISVDIDAPEETRYALSIGSPPTGYGVEMYREELLEIRDNINKALGDQ